MEIEPYGVEYERYALQQLFKRLRRRYDIQSVVEIPATGAKAAPSLYSLGWALAGARVTLINGAPSIREHWNSIGLGELVEFVECEDLNHTTLPDNHANIVWNFNVLPSYDNRDSLVAEMRRVSNSKLMFVHVDALNVGFPFHRLAHKLTNIPWTHGDIRFNHPKHFSSYLRSKGHEIIETGVVDCPCWPDSPGFRDIRLHRAHNKPPAPEEWHSQYVYWAGSGSFPTWLKLVHVLERLPLPLFIKHLYSHLFYIITDN